MSLQGGVCNRVVLVSVEQFYPKVDLSKRNGVRSDEKRLHRTLRKLGFSVDLHRDLSSEEIDQLFKEESRRPVKDYFLAVLSSHGEEGCIFGADGKPVQLSRIFRYFDNEYMEKKVKLFFIQACRGHDLDDGVEVDLVEFVEESFSPSLSVPIDTAVMFATAPGYAAFLNPFGSVFLQTLCKLLEEDGNRNLELTRLMTRLCHQVAYTFQARGRVAEGKKQMPCLLTRLTREVYPFAVAGKDACALGLSTAAVTGPDKVRMHMPLIS